MCGANCRFLSIGALKSRLNEVSTRRIVMSQQRTMMTIRPKLTLNSSLGIRITVPALIHQLNKENFHPIRNLLMDESMLIEDTEGNFNKSWEDIRYALHHDSALCKCDEVTQFQGTLIERLKARGDMEYIPENGEFNHVFLEGNTLWEKTFLFPTCSLSSILFYRSTPGSHAWSMTKAITSEEIKQQEEAIHARFSFLQRESYDIVLIAHKV